MAGGLLRVKAKTALAQELAERLVPEYKRITENFGASGARIEVRIQSIEDWPDERLLREVIGASKENPTTNEGDDE